MKTFNLLDLAGQVLALLVTLVIYLAHPHDGFAFLPIYFAVGGWQMLSFFVHSCLHENWIDRVARKRYGIAVLTVFLIGLVSWALVETPLGSMLLYFLFILLFVSPVLAIWYFVIGLKERTNLKKRRLVHLK